MDQKTSARYVEQFNNAWGLGIVFYDVPSDNEILTVMKSCAGAGWITVPTLTPNLNALMWAKTWGMMVTREDLEPLTDVHGGQVQYAQ